MSRVYLPSRTFTINNQRTIIIARRDRITRRRKRLPGPRINGKNIRSNEKIPAQIARMANVGPFVTTDRRHEMAAFDAGT